MKFSSLRLPSSLKGPVHWWIPSTAPRLPWSDPARVGSLDRCITPSGLPLRALCGRAAMAASSAPEVSSPTSLYALITALLSTGGGGYFGGGGGGTMPGISGGGGGGSSYVFVPLMADYVCVAGHDVQPGGLSHRPPPPLACGLVSRFVIHWDCRACFKREIPYALRGSGIRREDWQDKAVLAIR